MDKRCVYQMPRKRIIKYDFNNKYKKKRQKRNNEKIDILFFHFLDVIRHPSVNEYYSSHVEKNTKLEICQSFDNLKYRKKDNIEDKICYGDQIDIPCLAYMSFCYDINMVFVSNKIFCHLNKSKNGTNNIVYVVKPSKTIHVYERDTFDNLIQNMYEVKDCNKPINSQSYYKLGDLNEIVDVIGIEVKPKAKKADIYNQLKDYIEDAFDISEKID